jgi:hypothetical protein
LSRYDIDLQEISRICFHTNLTQKEKNKACAIIERRMEREEQLKLDGKGRGYYD